MGEGTGVEQIVEKAVSQVLENQVPRIREELVRRVLEDLPEPSSAGTGGGGDSGAEHLLKAVTAIQAGGTQKEILRVLLDNTVRYSGRGALFVVKAGAATGWQGRGFHRDDIDPIKDFSLKVSAGAPEQALRSRLPFSGSAGDIDAEFVSQFGAPGDNRLLVLPLVLKEKVAALIYADGGTETGGKLDCAALELLVRATSAWLEVVSLRKQALKEEAAEGGAEKAERAERSEMTAPKAAAVSSHPDPFAAHAPRHMAAAASAAASTVNDAQGAAAAVAPEPLVTAPAAEAADPASDTFAGLPPEDVEIHRKAQRFARLLVDEIKLYNQAKVADGRKNKDIYDRLKEDIEKSRATYQKRYGSTAAASADYFSQELVRSLAEDDSSIMGANFRRN